MRRRRAAVLAVALLAACTGDDDEAIPTSTTPASASSSSPTSTVEGETPIVGGTLRLGIARLPSLDPADTSPASPSSTIAADLLYDTLPALSEDPQTPDGGVTWRFTLRADALFADGRTVTSTDVEASLERVAARATDSIAAAPLEVLADVVVVDPRVVDVVLDRPMASLPEVLAAPQFGIVSADVVSLGSNPASNGTGPFRLAAVEGDVVRLVRAREGSALLDGVELHQHDDLNAAVDSFAAGALDWTLVPPERAEEVAESHGAAGFVPFQAELFLGFNLADPTFADVRFRRAIVAAVDRETVVRAVYFGFASALDSVVPVRVPGHDPEARCGQGCAHSLLTAARLLGEAFPPGGPPVPEIILDHEDSPEETALARAVEQQLEAAGIPVALRPHTGDEFPVFAASGQQALTRLGWVGAWPGPDAYLEPLFRTGARDNVFGYSDPAVDQLLDAAARALDPAERLRLLGEVESLVLAAAVIVPIAQFHLLSAASPAVRDLVPAVDGTFDGAAVWLAPS